MNDAPASSGRTQFKITLIVLGSLLLLGLITVVGARIYRLYNPPTRLPFINSASQPVTHCVLRGDQFGELFRAENIDPGESRKTTIHDLELKGEMIFEVTLSDGTQRSGSYSSDDENSYMPSLTYEVTDQKLRTNLEVRPRFRLSRYW